MPTTKSSKAATSARPHARREADDARLAEIATEAWSRASLVREPMRTTPKGRVLGCEEDVEHSLDEARDREGLAELHDKQRRRKPNLRERQHLAGRQRTRRQVEALKRARRRPRDEKGAQTAHWAVWFMMNWLLERRDADVFSTFPSVHAAAEAVVDGFATAGLGAEKLARPLGSADDRERRIELVRQHYLRHFDSR